MDAVTGTQEKRFLCDEMLRGVARWLRAAGYDTGLAANGESDRQLIGRAKAEGRCLITRDRRLVEYRDGPRYVLVLESNELNDCLRELTEKMAIHWLIRPFSRCMLCNTPIVQVPATAGEDRVPVDILENSVELFYCPTCDKFYWEGSHTRRMRGRLKALSEGRWGSWS